MTNSKGEIIVEPTVSEIAAMFGVSEERIRAQYLKNAVNIRKEAARVRSGGQNPNDFDPAFLEQRAKEYALKGGVA